MKRLIIFLFIIFSLTMLVDFHTSSLKNNSGHYTDAMIDQLSDYYVISSEHDNNFADYIGKFNMIV